MRIGAQAAAGIIMNAIIPVIINAAEAVLQVQIVVPPDRMIVPV
jgi:hypothetical protein